MSWVIGESWVASRGGTRRRSQRRKMVLDVDLNAPPIEHNDEGTSSNPPRSGTQPVAQFPLERWPGPVAQFAPQRGPEAQFPQNGGPFAVILDDDDDDDVILTSPRSFAEARNNSRRNRSGPFVNLAAEDPPRGTSNRNDRHRVSTNQPIVHEFFRTGNNRVTPNQPVVVQLLDIDTENPRKSKEQAAPPPPPPEPTFTCPVCIGPLVEEMSTKCGHIFCKGCIKTAIAAQGKCPTCRRKLAMKDTIRIYLPTLN